MVTGKKQRLFMILLCAAAALLAACGKQEQPSDTLEDPKTTVITEHRSAYEIWEDDWAVRFDYWYLGEKEKNPFLYRFTIQNMRYRFNDEWSEMLTIQEDSHGNKEYHVGYTISPIKSWFSGSEARKRDQKKVQSFLNQGLPPEQMLALDPDSISFEELDKDLFFRLMEAALKKEQEQKKEAPPRKLSYFFEILGQSDYLDGYKFQVSYVAQYGYLEKIVIDVLYKTGEEYNAYVQLSDLVRQGKADAGQEAVYAIIKKIEQAVVEQNCFTALKEEYQDLEEGGIDFFRLYVFLEDLETDAYITDDSKATLYNYEPNRPFKREIMTEEEYKASHPDD